MQNILKYRLRHALVVVHPNPMDLFIHSEINKSRKYESNNLTLYIYPQNFCTNDRPRILGHKCEKKISLSFPHPIKKEREYKLV